ncbi:DUF4331 family protein [Micromonospora sp. 4G57]|uniref:DUF4331 family protein n=1 Tax=Micromonospora sicca TaxID=2202420 RepID=A0ABU5JCC5_9ACTN|nr:MULTISPECIES: DUF4331 family protein [unclassified Micromonospora]MDZ5441672.1 DUF4331 family protein [Micromonospora sp. 4G57]MDZ5490233.1 DUF4331 family protein [Micromonospora sp. 4G53]
MSHHLDTPLAAQSGQLYLNDLFVFNGEQGTVFVMDVNSSVTRADIKRGFHAEARYEFKIHINGGELEELTYRVAFGEPDGQGKQELTLHALTGADARDDGATGTQLARGRTGEEVSGGNLRMWAGRITDPFYIDLDQLATVNDAFKNGAELDRSAWRPENAKNSFAGTTVDSIVLEVSRDEPMLGDGTRIGVWAATKLATDAGGWRQINRAGHPMMWPIFWPTDTDFSNPANVRHPCEDLRADGEEIASAVARVVAANGTAPDPQAYGWSVARAVYPDVLTYQVGTPANYGFATRNGRSMSDNPPEVMFSLVLNTGMTSGLTPDVTKDARSTTFPYVVPA